jgi:hypothetical protein
MILKALFNPSDINPCGGYRIYCAALTRKVGHVVNRLEDVQ